MLPLIIGLALFLGIHLLPTSPQTRTGLVERFGETSYKLAFSVVSLAGLILIVLGYHKLQVMPGKNPVLWTPPAGMRHATMALMLPAMILLVAAYIPSRIRTAARHPMLVAVKLWALGHLLVNGDLASIVLFGSFLAYAVYDRISVKRRGASNPMFAKPGTLMGDIAAVVIGVALYLAFVYGGHALLIGVPILS